MPEIGSDFSGSGSSDLGEIEVAQSDKQQGAYAAENVQRVCASKNIEKTAGRVRGQEDTLGYKLAPDKNLTGKKTKAQNCAYPPQRAKSRKIRFGQTPAGQFQRNAAGNQDCGVQPDDRREMKRRPIVGASLTNYIG